MYIDSRSLEYLLKTFSKSDLKKPNYPLIYIGKFLKNKSDIFDQSQQKYFYRSVIDNAIEESLLKSCEVIVNFILKE